MKRSSLRLYGPFLAIAAVQALFIAVAPSKPAGQQVATTQASITSRLAAGNADLARKDFQYVLSVDPANQQAIDGIAALDIPGSGGAPPRVGSAIGDR